ncbi:MAG: hypothetical protein AB1414_01665 [bacterium]
MVVIGGAKVKEMIKEAVKDALEEEVTRLRLSLVPYISDEEQEEIENFYEEPSKEITRSLIFGG